MKRNRYFLLFACICCSSIGLAQSFNKARLDSFFDALSANQKAMGSVAVSSNGKVVYTRTIGFAQASGPDTILAQTGARYRVGSITKMFTATMILQLVEEGKITLDTRLAKYFPTIPNADSITLGQLLQHRSGIHNFTNDPGYLAYMARPKTREEMVGIIAATKPDFKPGEKGAYSNSNYVLLGYLVALLDKKTYQQSLKDRITNKVGLRDTYVGEKTNPANKEVYSYRFLRGWQKAEETDMSIPGGAGAIVSTPSDLVKFIEALFAHKLVSTKALEQMKTIRDGYGMGMLQFPFYERKAFGHNGNIDGFYATLDYFPEDKVAIAYCTNGQNYPFNDVLLGVLNIYFNTAGYTLPSFKSLQLTNAQLDAFAGVYASPQVPIKITISRTGEKLFGQGTGQPAFALEATATNRFKFDAAGIVITFDTANKTMTLVQGGRTTLFTKE